MSEARAESIGWIFSHEWGGGGGGQGCVCVMPVNVYMWVCGYRRMPEADTGCHPLLSTVIFLSSTPAFPQGLSY